MRDRRRRRGNGRAVRPQAPVRRRGVSLSDPHWNWRGPPAELVKRGIAVAKNLVIKLKGVNEIDVHFLGYAQTDLNTVVWAEPISRAQLERNIARYKGRVTKEVRELIEKRREQRVKEWHNRNYRQKISTWDVSNQIKLEFDGKGSGVGELDKARVRYRRFELKNNPAIEADTRGNKRYYKVFKVAKSEAKNAGLVSVTQDFDLVAVLGGNLTSSPPSCGRKPMSTLRTSSTSSIPTRSRG